MSVSERMPEEVLVVDDDPCVRELLGEVLAGEGYDVLLAADGAAALELLKEGAEHAPSVILTDTLMPRMGGWEFIRAYRQLPSAHARIITMGFGAQTGAAPPAGAHPSGAEETPAVDAVLAKPFDLDQLLGLIARCAAENS